MHLVEAEAAALGDVDAALDPVGVASEELVHGAGALQLCFGVGGELGFRLFEGGAEADAMHHVGERLTCPRVIQRPVGCHHGHVMACGDAFGMLQPQAVVSIEVSPAGDGAALCEALAQPLEIDRRDGAARVVGNDGEQAIAVAGDLCGADPCLTLFMVGVGAREQATQRAVASVVFDEQRHTWIGVFVVRARLS